MDIGTFLNLLISLPFWLLGLTFVLVAVCWQLMFKDEPGGVITHLAVGTTGLFFLCIAYFLMVT